MLNKPRQQALLAYLVLHRQAPQSRQQVAFSFWPDSPEGQALTNLRKLVFQLRQTLPEPDTFFVANTYSIGWHNQAPFTLDVAELDHAIDELQQAHDLAPQTVETVVALYGGELLPTCYDDWILPIRHSLHERVVNTLTQALAELEAQHEYQVGLRVAEHLLRLDPLHEAAYRHLMHLRALSGDRAGALRAYHACVTMLEQELGVSPAMETQALYQQLLKHEPQPAKAPSPNSVLAPHNEHVPLVGRKQEWQMLQQAWHNMMGRGPQIITIWGEAGVGKTRLVEELLRWTRLRPGTVMYARAYGAEGALSYAPLTQWLRSESLRAGINKLDAMWQTELARLLPELLKALPGLPAPTAMTEGWQRQRFHEALAHAVLAAPAPCLLVLDDLQWCDAETLTWLRYLLRFDVHALLLVVGTVRTEAVDDTHPLHSLRQHLRREAQWTEFELLPLSVEETGVLARHLTNQDVDSWTAHLYQETEGNPLFIVETVRAGLLDKLTEHQGTPHLPDSVQAVISTRLAQLPHGTRQIAQLAAIVGRLFTVDVLIAASELGDLAVVERLDELWRRKVVREQANGYDFSHDKLREVIYQEISPMRRRHLHGRVAQALEHLNATRLPELAGELAAHYEHAGNWLRAAVCTHQAAAVAHKLHAHQDAIRYLRHGLELAEQLPDSDESKQIRLELLTYLSFLLMETQGTASAEVMHIYEQARTLNGKMTAVPDNLTLLHAMTTSHRVHADFTTALELATQLLYLAQQRQDAEHLVSARFQLGAIYFATGELSQARTHLEASAQRCAIQPANVRPHSWLGETLVLLGYLDSALVKSREALEPLRHNASPYDLVATLGDTLELRLVVGVAEAVDDDIELLVEIVHKHQFAQHETWSRFLQGWSLANSQGLPMVERMESGVRDFQKIGGRSRLSRFLGLVAEQYFRHGEIHKAGAIWEEAMLHLEQHAERFWEAELYRLKGEMLLAQGDASQAELWLQRALDTARNQQAKLLELRAAISLSRLWQQQGKQELAYAVLSDVYSWFTEGFDTPDLQEARALLEQMSGK
jgi:DNA-binding SARP family transcriptional activator/predicted ATPase